MALAADERAAGVEVTEDELTVRPMDGRRISVPPVWDPRLWNGTETQRKNWHIVGGGYGIHWEEIDEDLRTGGLLRGAPAPRQNSSEAAPSSRQRGDRVWENKERVEAAVELSENDDEKGD